MPLQEGWKWRKSPQNAGIWPGMLCGVMLGVEVPGAGCGTSPCATGTEGSGPASWCLAGFPSVEVGQAETPGAAELTDLEPATAKLNYSGQAEKLKSEAKPRGSARRGGPKRPRREEGAQHQHRAVLGHLGTMGNGIWVQLCPLGGEGQEEALGRNPSWCGPKSRRGFLISGASSAGVRSKPLAPSLARAQ